MNKILIVFILVISALSVNLFANQGVQVFSYDEGINDANISKPRIKIKNVGDVILNDFKVYYYFTTEDGKKPLLQDFYTPNCNIYLESVDNVNSYRIVYAYNLPLNPGQTFPNESGNVVGLRYDDWSNWDVSDDYSNNGESVFTENNKIVVENSAGSIIWGSAPNNTNSINPGDTIIQLTCGPDTTIVDEDGDGYARFSAYRTNLIFADNVYWYEEGVGTISPYKVDGFDLSFSIGVHKLVYYVKSLSDGWLHKNVTLTVLPKDGSSKELAVYAKEEAPYEANIVKPRIYVKNNGVDTIAGYYYYYYFNPESTPQLEDWYTPEANVSVEYVNDTLSRIKYNCLDKVLLPLSVSPNLSGNVVGLHYSDWSSFDNSNDFSYPGNSSNFVLTKNIPVFDSKGNLIYGNDPLVGNVGSDTTQYASVAPYFTQDMLAANKMLKDSLGFTFGPNPVQGNPASPITFYLNNTKLVNHKVVIVYSPDVRYTFYRKIDLGVLSSATVSKTDTFEFMVSDVGTLYYGQILVDGVPINAANPTYPFYFFVLP